MFDWIFINCIWYESYMYVNQCKNEYETSEMISDSALVIQRIRRRVMQLAELTK